MTRPGLCTYLAILIGAFGCGNFPEKEIPTVAESGSADWRSTATVGGAALHHEADDEEVAALLDALVHQQVTVVEADSSLSEYLDDDAFDRELALMTRVADMAHERGLRIVWYYPTLEVITIGGEHKASSMFKDHPDWVQRSADGEPNVFYGSKVFWVEEGDESAWMSPLSPYREVFLTRAEKIAQTGVDGLWVDVPLYNDVVGRWASYTPAELAAFKADTGHEGPSIDTWGNLDPADPAARAWIRWRHEQLTDFLVDVWRRTRRVNPEFNLIVETVTMDYNAAVFEGLDGAFHLPHVSPNELGVPEPVLHEGFWHVWEIDVVSDFDAMKRAHWDDWANMIAMFEFGRGADLVVAAGAEARPTWSFTYGYEDEDAQAVMAVSVAAQVNPYELKSPEMTTTVSPAFRTALFGWIRANESVFFESRSAARVAILHSSESRDYLDGACSYNGECGVALFSTALPTTLTDEPWWTDSESDSVKATNYLAEYRGMVKALTELHVPFDILTAANLDRDRWQTFGTAVGADSWASVRDELALRYDVVIAPSLQAVTDGQAAGIAELMDKGVRVVFTGELPGDLPPGTLDGWGIARKVPAFEGKVATTPVPGECPAPVVAANSYRCAGPVGRTVMLTEAVDTAARREQLTGLAKELPKLLSDASPVRLPTEVGVPGQLYVQVYDHPTAGPGERGTRVLHVVNLTHGDGSFEVGPTPPFVVELDVPTWLGDELSVTRSSPRLGDTALGACPSGASGACWRTGDNKLALTVDFNGGEAINLAWIVTAAP